MSRKKFTRKLDINRFDIDIVLDFISKMKDSKKKKKKSKSKDTKSKKKKK